MDLQFFVHIKENNNHYFFFQILFQSAVAQAVATFYSELGQYSPCLHQLGNGKLCGIAKLSHTTGHFGNRAGDHDGPPPPPDALPIITQRIKDLKVIVCYFLPLFLNTFLSFFSSPF
jgi:hypothetical protein